MRRKNRKFRKLRRFIRNGLLTLSVIVAMVIFILASFKLTFEHPQTVLTMVLSGGYIMVFVWANEVE